MHQRCVNTHYLLLTYARSSKYQQDAGFAEVSDKNETKVPRYLDYKNIISQMTAEK